jgi:hypothetical protein
MGKLILTFINKVYHYLFVVLLLAGCSERYELQLQKGNFIDKKILKYTKKIIPLSKNTILVLEIPHKEDPFIKQKLLALFDKNLKLLNFEKFNNQVLTAKSDALLCILREKEEKDNLRILEINYHDKVITSQNLTFNSIIISYKLLSRNQIKLTFKKCSKDLYFNYKLQKRAASYMDSMSEYDVTEQLTINISECVFNQERNEIELIKLQDNKLESEILMLANGITVDEILRKIVQN